MKIPTTIFLLFICNLFYAQITEHNMWWNSLSLGNPAFSGLQYKHDATSTGNYMKFGDISSSLITSGIYDIQVEKLHGGLGLHYSYNESSDLYSNIHLNLNYSFHHRFNDHNVISAGVSTGISYSEFENNWFSVDGVENDIAIPGYDHKTFLDINTGLAFKSKNMLLGISIVDIHPNKKNEVILFHSIQPKLILTSAYKINISEKWTLTPRVIYTERDSFSRLGMNITGTFDDKIWAGVTYTDNETIATMAGIVLFKKINLGYANSFPMNQVNSFNVTNHELFLAFRIH